MILFSWIVYCRFFSFSFPVLDSELWAMYVLFGFLENKVKETFAAICLVGYYICRHEILLAYLVSASYCKSLKNLDHFCMKQEETPVLYLWRIRFHY